MDASHSSPSVPSISFDAFRRRALARTAGTTRGAVAARRRGRTGVEPPESIRKAVRAMQAGAFFSVVSIAGGFLQRDELRVRMAKDDPTLSGSTLDAFVTAGLVLNVAIGFLAAGLYLWLAQANREGRAWARTVGSMLFGLLVLSTLMGFAALPVTVESLVLSLVNLTIAAAALLFLYRPDANRWFEAASADERARERGRSRLR